jgi:NAD+ synthetase
MPVLNPTALIADRVAAIAAFHRDAGIARAELDVSGGVDSAVMLGLLVRAIGGENVTAVYSGIHSSEESRARARAVAEAFGVSLVDLTLDDVYERLVAEVRKGLVRAGVGAEEIDARCAEDPTILGSIRSCLRAPVGRAANRLTGGGIRHGTGNECEDRWLRFYQKGGDGEVDTNPLAMLAKGEVYQLARALGVPDEIIEAVPTPDLQGVGERHNDEAELAAASGGVQWTYSRIDLETGEYSSVGTIERLSRMLDAIGEAALFGPLDPLAGGGAVAVARAREFFRGYDDEEIRGFIASARRWEALTRHKLNPACPTLGTRAGLVEAGILSDALRVECGTAA